MGRKWDFVSKDSDVLSDQTRKSNHWPGWRDQTTEMKKSVFTLDQIEFWHQQDDRF